MLTNRFHPSNVCIAIDLEEVLLRICLVASKPPVEILAYLTELCRRVQPAALPRNFLDVPLSTLLDVVQEVLGQHDSLSPNSVKVYLDDLRYRLNRWGRRLGATTLRDHLPRGGTTSLAFMVGRVTRRLERVRFRWGARKVFKLFVKARRKDVFIFLRARFWLDKASVEEATNDTFLRVEQKLRRFDPARRPLAKFTFGQAWFLMKEYFRAFMRRAKWELSLQAQSGTEKSLEQILAAPVSRELSGRLYTVKLHLTCLLFALVKPPHQIIVFILCCLFDRTPLEILEEYSHVTLRTVADQIEREFQRVSEAPERLVRAGFKRLRARMNMTLAELIRGKVRQAAYGLLLPRRAGDIPLGEYFPGADDREKSLKLVQAWYSVMKALVTGSNGWLPSEPPPAGPQPPRKISPPDGPSSTGAACEGHGRKKRKKRKKKRRPGNPPNT